MVETRIEEIVREFAEKFEEKDRGIAQSIIEYVDALQRIYDKGAKETCFERFDSFLSSNEINALTELRKDPLDNYIKPAFEALGCSHIYREYVEWGLANIIAEKSQ